MKGKLGYLVAIIVVVAVGLLALVSSVAWLPDFSGREITLGEWTAPDRTGFRVYQYWNKSDLYTTLFEVTSPAGKTIEYYISGDDSKCWSGCQLVASATPSEIRLMFGRKERGHFNLEKGEFSRNGITENGYEKP